MCRILIFGRDNRSYELSKIVSGKGRDSKVDYFSRDNFIYKNIQSNHYDTIILPIPTRLTKDNKITEFDISIEQLIGNWVNAKIIYGAKKNIRELNKVGAYNLLFDEKFVMENAYLTAKAACEIAFDEIQAKGKICMVVGKGRIGKYLCEMLNKIGCKIILVSKRYMQYKNIDKYYKCIDYGRISNNIKECQYIFNTAPYNYFSFDELDKYIGTYFELASMPYGFAHSSSELPKSVQICSFLPGKYYPYEAAKIIYESIIEYI